MASLQGRRGCEGERFLLPWLLCRLKQWEGKDIAIWDNARIRTPDFATLRSSLTAPTSSPNVTILQHHFLAIHKSGRRWYEKRWSDSSWEATWAGPTIVLSFGALLCILTMHAYLRFTASSRLASSSDSLQGAFTAEDTNLTLDSDSNEYEDGSDAEGGLHSKLARPLSKLFSARGKSRRIASKDSGVKRNSSVVRITSSDPRSSLSSSPIQLDLETKSIAPSVLDGQADSSTLNIVQHTASVARRRRESGRLLNGIKGKSSPSRAGSPLARTGSPHSASTSAMPGRSSKSSLRRSSGAGLEKKTSAAELLQSQESKGSASEQDFVEEEQPILSATFPYPASILRREPQIYASATSLSDPDSSSSSYSDAFFDAGQSADLSATSLESELAFDVSVAYPIGRGRLPPGAGYGPSSPLRAMNSPLHRLGGLNSAQKQALWPEKRTRSIKLQEPDWSPYVNVHARAKERMETAAQVAARPRSTSPLSPPSPISTPLAATPVAEEGSAASAYTDTNHPILDEEFWYERFTQSTAAAGRDWDWRKRRKARHMEVEAAAVAAAAATIYGSGREASRADHNGSSTLLSYTDGSTPNLAEIGNVGKTDVQLQKQHFEQPRQVTPYNRSEEGHGRPTLTITPVDSLAFGPGGRGSPLRPYERQQPSSPFGKGLRLRKYSSPGSGAATDEVMEDEEGSLHPDARGSAISSSSAFSSAISRRSRAKRSRRASETDKTGSEEALSVPSRLSSLTPKVVKRGLHAKRERDALLTARLLAEAEEVNTDEEDAVEGEKELRQMQQSRLAPPSQAAQVRKSASSSLLNERYSRSNGSASAIDVIPEGVWSSADAYGAAPAQPTAAPRHIPPRRLSSTDVAALSNRSANPRWPGVMMGGSDLVREGSKTDSVSSTGSSTVHQDRPGAAYSHRSRTASRKGILSSAAQAVFPNVVIPNGETTLDRGNESGSPAITA